MPLLTTQKDIRERLVTLIVSHTSIPAEAVGWNSPIWDHFPENSRRIEHPTVTSFVDDVQAEFNVYLTEDEWEEPTPDSLAQIIRAKIANPALSIVRWTDERAARKKGMIASFVFLVIAFPAMFFFGSGPWLTRVVIGLGLPVFLAAMLVGGYHNDVRKLDASAPKKV